MVSSLLNKPLNEHTLNEIKSYLDNQALGLSEYYLLIKQQLIILNKLEQYGETLQIGEAFLSNLNNNINFSIDTNFYYALYYANVQIKNYQNAYHYYQLRRDALPVIEKYLAIYDLVDFKKITGQSYLRDLELVLEDEMPGDDRINFSLMLLALYEETKSYSKMLALSIETMKNDPEDRALEYQLLSLFELENYERCALLSSEYIYLSSKRVLCFYYLLKIHFIKEEWHQILILDSEYSMYLEQLEESKLIEAYELLISFYKDIEKNNHSRTFYEEKLSDLRKTIKKELKQKQNKIKKDNIEFDITKSNQSEQQTQPINKKISNNLLITQFEIAHNISREFIKLSNNDLTIREFIRLLTIEFEQEISFSKIIIYTTKDNVIYHYNKQRLYDKVLNVEQIAQTIIEDYINNGREILTDGKYISYQKDILTNKEYTDDVKFIYSFPLHDLGSVTIYLDYEIKEDQYYDIFKHYSNLIYMILVSHHKNEAITTNLNTYNSLFNSKLLPLRKLELSLLTYNVEASQIFELGKNINLNNFINELNYITQNEYELLLKQVINNPNKLYSIIYTYKNKTIEEKLIGINETGSNNEDDVIVYSFYNNLTNYKNEKEALIKEATICELTGLNNLNSLNKTLPGLLNEKGSLVLIRLSSDLKIIYGSPKFNEFFKEFAHLTKKHFNDFITYRYGDFDLFIYLRDNDIRTVDKIIKTYFDYINNYHPVSIPYEKFNISSSIIRYPVVTKETNINLLFRYLEVSINKLRNKKDDYNYVFFEYPVYEQELLEQQIIDYINTGIEKKQLEFMFRPIVNTTRWTTTFYESILTIPNLNIDNRYIYQVAKQRDKHIELDRFHILMVLNYLKELKDETNKLINVVIPIHKNTFQQSSFNNFFIKQMREYKIDGKFLTLKIMNDDFNAIPHFNKIKELKLLGVKIGIKDIKNSLGTDISQIYFELNYESNEVLQYLQAINEFCIQNEINIIIDSVETNNQQDKLTKIGIQYLTGSLYANTNPDELLLKIKKQN